MDRLELIELIGMNHLQMSKPHLRSGKSEGLMMPDFFLWEENRNKKTEAWKLAKLVGFSTSKKKAIDLRGKKTSANVEERNYLSMLISKNKKVALKLCEIKKIKNYDFLKLFPKYVLPQYFGNI